MQLLSIMSMETKNNLKQDQMNIKSFTKEETNQTGKLPGSILIHGKNESGNAA